MSSCLLYIIILIRWLHIILDEKKESRESFMADIK